MQMTVRTRERSALPPSDGLELHNSFTFWLARLASAMRESLEKDLADWEINWSQWLILNSLYQGEVTTPAQVASHIAADRSAVTRLLDRLEHKSLVKREHDGLDRRSVKLHLTDKGREVAQVLNRLAEEHQARFLGQLHPTELRAFKANIQKLLRAADIETSKLWQHV